MPKVIEVIYKTQVPDSISLKEIQQWLEFVLANKGSIDGNPMENFEVTPIDGSIAFKQVSIRTLVQAIAEMESGDMRYELGYASTFNAYLHRVKDHNLVQEAQLELHMRPDDEEFVFKAAVQLYTKILANGVSITECLVLGAYLFLLNKKYPSSRKFLELLAELAPEDLLWIKKMARYTLDN